MDRSSVIVILCASSPWQPPSGPFSHMQSTCIFPVQARDAGRRGAYRLSMPSTFFRRRLSCSWASTTARRRALHQARLALAPAPWYIRIEPWPGENRPEGHPGRRRALGINPTKTGDPRRSHYRCTICALASWRCISGRSRSCRSTRSPSVVEISSPPRGNFVTFRPRCRANSELVKGLHITSHLA